MQKFWENGIEFCWNDNEGDLINIFFLVLLDIGILCIIRNVHLSSFGLFFPIFCFLFFGIGALQLIYYCRRKIPQLYMNEKEISVRGNDISWDWITEVKKNDVSGPRSFKPRYQILIHYYAPGKKRKRVAGLLPDPEELQELMDFIEAYWNYYRIQ